MHTHIDRHTHTHELSDSFHRFHRVSSFSSLVPPLPPGPSDPASSLCLLVLLLRRSLPFLLRPSPSPRPRPPSPSSRRREHSLANLPYTFVCLNWVAFYTRAWSVNRILNYYSDCVLPASRYLPGPRPPSAPAYPSRSPIHPPTLPPSRPPAP